MKERDHRIEILRFVFSLLIVAYHASNVGHIKIPRGYAYVEFFLYVQGYFLFRHAAQKERLSAREAAADSLGYTKKLLVKLMPYIVICVTVQYLLKIFAGDIGKSSILFSLPYEIALLPVSGLHDSILMMHLWYLSGVMIVLPVLSYFVFRRYDSTARVILPVLPILIYGALCVCYGDVPISGYTIEGIAVTLLRVTAGLTAGCMAARVVDGLRRYTYTRFGQILMTAVEIGSFLLAIGIAFLSKSDERPTAVFTAFACLFIGLCLLLSGKTLTRRFRFRPALFLGKLSVPIYVGHFNAGTLVTILMASAALPLKLIGFTILSLVWALLLYYAAKVFPRLKALVICQDNPEQSDE